MCIGEAPYRLTGRCDGDRIVHRPIVPAGRPIAGTDRAYPIDVRSFLAGRGSAVLAQALAEDVAAFLRELPHGDPAFFAARSPGAFDYRATVLAAFVARHVRYERAARNDPWRFPEETLCLRAGDCEDQALLLAALLLACGVSSYCVRVTLGRVRVDGQDHDHVWVMYQTEAGRWIPLDPVLSRTPRGGGPPVEYAPAYVFNDDHLWTVGNEPLDPARLATRWASFHPGFGGTMHRTLVHQALEPILRDEDRWVLQRIDGHFVYDGHYKEDIDITPDYDPLNHCDNGYVPEAWARIRQHLAAFAADNVRGLDCFEKAAHTIGDFYAHTAWAHFARVADGDPPHCELFDPADPEAGVGRFIDYGAGSGFDLASGPTSVNKKVYSGPRAAAAEYWSGKIASGRWGQPGDGGSDKLADRLIAAPDFAWRGALPHHDEMCVESELPKPTHKIYGPRQHAEQYRLRCNAVILHVRAAFEAGWKGTFAAT